MEELTGDRESPLRHVDSSHINPVELRAPVLYVNDHPLYNNYDYIHGKLTSDFPSEEAESDTDSFVTASPAEDEHFLVVPPRAFSRKQRERLRQQYIHTCTKEVDSKPTSELQVEPEARIRPGSSFTVPEIRVNDRPVEYGSFSGCVYDFLNGKLIEHPDIDEAVCDDNEYYDVEGHILPPHAHSTIQERIDRRYDFFDFEIFGDEEEEEEEGIDGQPMDVDADEDLFDLGQIRLPHSALSQIFAKGEAIDGKYNCVTGKPNSGSKILDDTLFDFDADEDVIDPDFARLFTPFGSKLQSSDGEEFRH